MRWVYLVGLLGVGGTFLGDVWFDIDYRFAANISLIYIATAVTVFTVLYGARSRWRANRIGKTFFTKCVFLSMVLWQAVASVWIDNDYPYRHVIRFIIYTLAAVAYMPMLWVLRIEQQRNTDLVDGEVPVGPPRRRRPTARGRDGDGERLTQTPGAGVSHDGACGE